MKFLSALALLACVSLSTAQAQNSEKVVKINATADKPDEAGNQTVAITIEIDKPWHIYANPVGNDMLTPVQTKVTFKGVEDAKITYPPGHLVKDKDGDYSTYEGKVVIKAQVKRAKGATGPLEFSVKVQACNKDSCLFPATVKKSIP
jgi:DsbC/DsbD-like thiol-disulfide interchange protein